MGVFGITIFSGHQSRKYRKYSRCAPRHNKKLSTLKIRNHWIMVVGYIKFQNFVSQAFEQI